MNGITVSKKQMKKNFLWIVLFGLIFLKYVIQIDFPQEVILFVFAIMVLMGNKEEIITLSACCIPLYTSMNYLYAVLTCLTVYLIRYGKEMKIGEAVFPVLFIWIWEIMHCVSDGTSIKDGIVFIMPYILCLFVMFSNIKEVRYGIVMRTLSVCILFMCFVVLSKLLVESGFQIKGMFMNMQRLGSLTGAEETGAYFNPNTLGYFCILSSTGLIQTILSGQGKKTDYLMIGVLIIFGLMTMSRTYLVCLLAMIFLFFLIKDKKKYGKVKFIGAILLAGGVIFGTLSIVFPSVLESLVMRLNVKDISSGRMELLAKYNEYSFHSSESLFFGTGLSGMNEKIKAYFTTYINVPHNGIQEIFVVWGFPGLILFLLFLHSIIKKSRKVLPNQKLINYIPLILLLLKVQAGQLVTSFYTMLMFMLAYLSLCCDFRKMEMASDLTDREDKLDI